MNKENIIKTLKKELPYLRSEYNIKKMGLFGSFVKGKQHKGSDIDIIVEFKKPLGIRFVDFAEHIESVLGKDVDVLTLEGIKSIRIKEIADNIKRSILYV